MLKLMTVTLWLKLLAIVSAAICSLFGFSWFYFEPEAQTGTITANEWLFSFWLLGIVCCGFVATSLPRFRRLAALLFCWGVSVVPLLLAALMVVESCFVSDGNLARYYRMGCLVVLVISFLFELRVYYVFRKRFQNANMRLDAREPHK